MPRGKTKIIKATENVLILEATIGKDYRLSIPKSVRHLITPDDKVVVVTIERKVREGGS